PLNMGVLNMLDTKYFLVPDQATGAVGIQKNDSVLGGAWFVKEIKTVKGPVEELKSLEKFEPSLTAFIDKNQNAAITQPVADTSAKIRLTKYTNDEIGYESD